MRIKGNGCPKERKAKKVSSQKELIKKQISMNFRTSQLRLDMIKKIVIELRNSSKWRHVRIFLNI